MYKTMPSTDESRFARAGLYWLKTLISNSSWFVRLRASSREMLEGERESLRAIARTDSPHCLQAEMAYRSCRVIWALIDSPLLGGGEEP